jgi:hypothetical protein
MEKPVYDVTPQTFEEMVAYVIKLNENTAKGIVALAGLIEKQNEKILWIADQLDLNLDAA